MTRYFGNFYHPAFLNQKGDRMPNDTGWQTRHLQAVSTPKDAEVAIVGMFQAWARYADRHEMRYESGVGEDGVLGLAWAQVGANLRTLLNGELGRLDAGTLDSFICETLLAEGFDPDRL